MRIGASMAIIPLALYGARNERVDALIRSLDINNDQLVWFTQWLPKMFTIASQPLFEDSYWNVPKIFENYYVSEESKVLILEARDRIQGYVIIHLDYWGMDKKPCVYIPFLAAAPWNRSLHGLNGREFKGIGKILVATACLLGEKYISTSVLELHSLSSTEGFYSRIGFRETGRKNEEGLREFRLERERSLDLIRFLLPHIKKDASDE